MTKEEMLQKYHDWIFAISAYRMALNTIEIDKQTVAPAGGNAYRDKRSAYLAGQLFSLETDPEMYEILSALNKDETLDGDDKRAVQLYLKEADNNRCIPHDEFVAYRNLIDTSWNVWLKAKQTNDYDSFAPVLADVIAAKKKLYGYRQSDLSLYDRMLDDYEPGMNQQKYDAFFAKVQKQFRGERIAFSENGAGTNACP